MTPLQQCILEIYKEIKRICDKHRITYYGTSGTCLGAIRHQGFIPWDDDMDMVIPIEEMDFFLEKCKEELPPHLEIFSPFERTRYTHCIFKIIDKRTTFVEKAFEKYPEVWSGVWVDVIPLCGVPSGKLRRRLFYSRFWLQMYMDLHLRMEYDGNRLRGLHKLIQKMAMRHGDPNYYMKKQYRLIQAHPVKRAEYVLEAGFFKFARWTSKREWFDGRKNVPFEDTKMYIPQDYHEYLLNQMGEYMTFPPEEDRKPHTGFVDLQTPYRHYMKHPEQVIGNWNNTLG